MKGNSPGLRVYLRQLGLVTAEHIAVLVEKEDPRGLCALVDSAYTVGELHLDFIIL